MNLADLRDFVANVLDYNVQGNTKYRAQVDSLLTDAHDRIITEKPFDFAQTEVELKARKDYKFTGTVTATSGSRTIGSSAGEFNSSMDGAILQIAGREVTIGWVETGSVAYLLEEFGGTSTAYSGCFVVWRYLDLPQDLVSIMQIFKRSMTTSPTNPGVMEALTQYEDEWQNLPLNDASLPRYWVPAEAIEVPAPRAASGVAAAAAAPGQGARTLEVAMVNVWAGRESGLSSTKTTITLTDAQALTLTPEALTTYRPYYRRYYIRAPSLGLYAWRRAATSTGVTDVAPTGGVTLTIPVSLTALQGENYINNNPRFNGNGGNTRRVRLYPRQSEDSLYNLRYLQRPFLLCEDGDVPVVPPPHQVVLAYKALELALNKHDQQANSQLWARKCQAEMQALERRYLTQTPMRMIKGNWGAGGVMDRSGKWSPYGKLSWGG